VKKSEAGQLCKSACYISMHAQGHISHAVPGAAGIVAQYSQPEELSFTSSRFLTAGNSSLLLPGAIGRAPLSFPALDWVSTGCLTLLSAAHTALLRHSQEGYFKPAWIPTAK